jgi:hypothetical protein
MRTLFQLQLLDNAGPLYDILSHYNSFPRLAWVLRANDSRQNMNWNQTKRFEGFQDAADYLLNLLDLYDLSINKMIVHGSNTCSVCGKSLKHTETINVINSMLNDQLPFDAQAAINCYIENMADGFPKFC